MQIGDDIEEEKVPKSKSFHITVVDLKPAVIARDLILLMILDLLSVNKGLDGVFTSSHMHVFYYVFISPLLPPKLYTWLQRYIGMAIAALDDPRTLPSFIDVPQMYRKDVLRVLRQWQRETPDEYPTSRLRKATTDGLRRASLEKQMHFGLPGDIPVPGCEKQAAFYKRTGILMLSSTEDQVFCEESPELYQAYRTFGRNGEKKLDQQVLASVDATWGPNVTMVDLDYQHNKEPDYVDIDVANDPFEWANKLEEAGLVDLRSVGASGLFDCVGPWLQYIILALGRIKHRLKIEACVGDVTEILEQIRYGLIGHRQTNGDDSKTGQADSTASPQNVAVSKKQRSKKKPVKTSSGGYPQLYDRIHLSNIPDYIGGTLSTFLYALPVLHSGDGSYVTATCLRNPPRFQSLTHFNKEYIALSASTDLEKAFHVRVDDLPPGPGPMPLINYRKWHQCHRSQTLSDRLSRDALETWLYRLVFKLSIPKERKIRDNTLIYSPLNLTVFLRLCNHLHSVGYPAHWISGVITSILSGKVRTKARPPQSDPLKIREVKTEMPVLEQSTAPFIAELSTLVILRLPILSFGVQTTTVAAANTVHKYSFTLEANPDDPVTEPPHFVLAFVNTKLFPFGTKNLRSYLLGDELGDCSAKAKAVREQGLHIITTWIWDRASKTAAFWLRSDVMEEIRKEHWSVAIWRSDDWSPQTKFLPVTVAQDAGVF